MVVFALIASSLSHVCTSSGICVCSVTQLTSFSVMGVMVTGLTLTVKEPGARVAFLEEQMEAEGTETGSRFGRFVVVHDQGGKTRRKVGAQCDCGAERTVRLDHLRKGATRSCGCLQQEVRSSTHRTHGGSRDKLYKAWHEMRSRCQIPTHPAYPGYGGRGITVAPEWEEYAVFARDIGPRPSAAHTIDRINNDEGYKPGNVRWATKVQQAQNRRSSRLITFKGETRCLKEWSEKLGFPYAALGARIRGGMPVAEAFTRPVQLKPRRSA